MIMISEIPAFSAVIYYVICYSHGDFSAAAMAQEDWGPCISEADGFVSVFLFSMETQHTIGYGTRQTTTNCPHAIVLMSLQVTTPDIQISSLDICIDHILWTGCI